VKYRRRETIEVDINEKHGIEDKAETGPINPGSKS
jgi:hypothetical protein